MLVTSKWIHVTFRWLLLLYHLPLVSSSLSSASAMLLLFRNIIISCKNSAHVTFVMSNKHFSAFISHVCVCISGFHISHKIVSKWIANCFTYWNILNEIIFCSVQTLVGNIFLPRLMFRGRKEGKSSSAFGHLNYKWMCLCVCMFGRNGRKNTKKPFFLLGLSCLTQIHAPVRFYYNLV